MTAKPIASVPEAPMTPARLRTILAAYGAAPAHWPHAERAAAEALIDTSAEARALLSEATQLDALLGLVHPPAPSATLANRLRRRRFGWRGFRAVGWVERLGGRARRWMTSPRHQIAAVAGALLLGVLVGNGIPGASDPTTLESADTVPSGVPFAAAQRNPGSVSVADPVRARGQWTSFVAASGQSSSSNGDPAYDAPDPFGSAAHGLDLVDGARISGVSAPVTGEPFGNIPLL